MHFMKMTILMLALCLAACGSDEQKANIGIKYEHFAKALNDKKSQFKISDALGDKNSEGSHHLKVEYFFENATTLKCVINKSDHLIHSITVINKVDADHNVNQINLTMDGPLLVSLITQSLNQQLNPEDIEPVVLSAFATAKERPDILQREVFHKARYSLTFDTALNAYVFSVNPI